MRKSRVACAFFCSAISILGMVAVSAEASTETEVGVGYVQDANGLVVQSGLGHCVKTQFWEPATADEKCDPQYFRHDTAPAPVTRPVVQPKPYVYHPVVQPKPANPVPVKHKMTFAAGAFFDTDMAVLRTSATHVLDELVSAIKPVELEVVIITGYTDSRGKPAYNQKLSEQRADVVRNYLVQKGIDPNLLYAEGKGPQDPLGDNATLAGRAKNRRVDIEVIGTSTRGDMKNVDMSFQDNTATADHGPHFLAQQKQKRVRAQHRSSASMKKQKEELQKIYNDDKDTKKTGMTTEKHTTPVAKTETVEHNSAS